MVSDPLRMAGDFRPILPPRGAGEAPPSFKIKVVPAAPESREFVPCDAPSVPAGGPAHAACGTAVGMPPVVTLRREGDRVTGIHIRCSCGQVIELACQY